MKITESQLRKAIRKALKEYSYEPFVNPFSDPPSQHDPIKFKPGELKAAKDMYDEGECPTCHGKGYVMGKTCKLCAGEGEL